MIIIFDLDYTLLDTGRLHQKLAEIFDQENYRADYQAHFKNKGVNFDGEKYLEILKAEGRIDRAREKELRLKLDELAENTEEYLKAGAGAVLEQLKAEGNKLVLVTFGNEKWQKNKVKNLSIKKYFAEIVFEEREKGKSEFLKSLSESGEEILIINDNLSEAVEMKKLLGEKAEFKLVKGKYNEKARHDVENLNELIAGKKAERKNDELNLR